MRKLGIQIGLFAGIMLLTFYAVFRKQDLSQIGKALMQMSILGILSAMCLGVFFVAAEGSMIWYLLRKMGGTTGILRCIGYSFVGFFFSGITPSATGGQPMQLYYMKKDGNSLSESSVVLMTVAVIYKFVLVVTGTLILIFWNGPLKFWLQQFYILYLAGFFLNVVVVAVLLLVMFTPQIIRKVMLWAGKLLARCRILKNETAAAEKVDAFIGGYQHAITFLKTHKRVVGTVILGTFLQRGSAFVLTYVVYRGLGLSGNSILEIVLLQAAVYIAVDMLPIPGAQGITEAMYQAVFLGIFTEKYLMTSLCVTRGVSFYLIMAVSCGVVVLYWRQERKRSKKTADL